MWRRGGACPTLEFLHLLKSYPVISRHCRSRELLPDPDDAPGQGQRLPVTTPVASAPAPSFTAFRTSSESGGEPRWPPTAAKLPSSNELIVTHIFGWTPGMSERWKKAVAGGVGLSSYCKLGRKCLFSPEDI